MAESGRAGRGGVGEAEAAPAWLAGTSSARAALVSALERIAPSDAAVLVEGESGTGKNLAARWLHAHSARANGPLVEVDLSALTPTLAEAELFGHVAGAFTGALGARTGRFVRAHGGTLVLDGIERLGEALQGKLLRTLQERVVEPLGAEEAVPIDVRVVATSGTPLHERMRAHKFRTDLYYRIAVVRLVVPSLKSRAEDVPAIARALVRRVAERAGVKAREIAEASLARLGAHAWPGNLHELENALERVLVLGGGSGPIGPEELDFLAESVAGMSNRVAREALAHGVTLGELERAMFEEALLEARGNVTAAAKLVGLTRRAFDLRHERRARGDSASGDATGEAT